MQNITGDTYTITGGPLQPHEYIVIKREMSAGDEAFIQNHATTMAGTKKKPEVRLTIGNIKLATLKRMIVSWNLTKADGSGQQVTIPLSDQAIEDLPRRISSYINDEIDRLNPDDEEDIEAFTSAASGSSEGS